MINQILNYLISRMKKRSITRRRVKRTHVPKRRTTVKRNQKRNVRRKRGGANNNNMNLNPLTRAVLKEDTDEIEELLENDALINEKNKDGKTALMYAIETKNEDIIELLVDKILDKLEWANENYDRTEDDIDTSDKNGNTALMYAILEDIHPSIIQSILNCGAEVFQYNKEGETTLHFASTIGSLPIVKLLHRYIFNDDVWQETFVNKQTKEDGQTALHLAVSSHSLPVVKYLVETGADIMIEDANGETAVNYADDKKFKDIAQYFAELIAKEKYPNWKIVNNYNKVNKNKGK